MIAMATREPDGLSEFVRNTSAPYAVLAGGCVSLFGSLLINVVVSLITHNIKTDEDRALEWKKTKSNR